MPHEAAVYLDSRCLRTPARVLEARMLQHAESTLVALNHEQEDHDDEAASDEVSTGLLRRDREPERIGPGQLARQTLRSHPRSGELGASRVCFPPSARPGKQPGRGRDRDSVRYEASDATARRTATTGVIGSLS
jgi:hypothetical protein